MKTIKDVEVKGKRILLRVDFNMPQNKEGAITDDTKMVAALPTINYLLDKGAKVIIMSHLGRPKGQPNPKFSLGPMAEYLSKLLGQTVPLAPGCVEPEVEAMAQQMKDGDAILLENVRYYKEEEKNDPDFAKQLARLGDIFVNDAFGTAHRAHVSTAGLAAYLPTYSGFLMAREVEMLGDVVNRKQSPRLAILGGAKVVDKLGLISNMLEKMDVILIGGGMANTFIAAKGYAIGKSICETELFNEANRLLQKAKDINKKLLLPIDVLVAKELSDTADTRAVALDAVGGDDLIGDIGPKTIELYTQEIKAASSIIWNGPVGVFEYAPFSDGTFSLAHAIADAPGISIIGGGDSAAAVQGLGINDRITHISTGGGATLEFLEGIDLPGVKVCR